MNVKEIVFNAITSKTPFDCLPDGSSRLKEDLAIDSMKYADIIVDIEDAVGFRFSIESLDLENLKTINDFLAATNQLLVDNNAL